ncbi:MAG: Holliday junction branch migration DNA helicase RuvB [Clostridiales bacterium]|jgi:Holliday junction DNA helicase RuvB|nr:Holliday junction branch migration DNA helicase RuvB [Clostridiales bacterium]
MQELEDDRIISSMKTDIDDEDSDNILRPKLLKEYVGQEKIKENLGVYIRSAKKRKDALDHVLVYGPPGLGKTTLAHIIANEMGSHIWVTSGPAIEKAGDLASIVTKIEKNDVLFIDEIHRLKHSVGEILYPILEDYSFDLVVGKGPSARIINLQIPHFTLIGATTKMGKLAKPLTNRFGITLRLEPYSLDELNRIVRRSAPLLGVDIKQEAATEISRRSRGTPRIANRLLKRVRDFAEDQGSNTITHAIALNALDEMGVDKLGLDDVEINLLKIMIQKFDGGPVGLDTLSAATDEDRDTIEDVYEPYLMQLGFLSKTPRGRVCLKAAYEHLGEKKTTQKPTQQFSFFKDANDNDADL